MKEYIRDRTGLIIGQIDGNIIRDNSGKQIGNYDESSGYTRQRNGQIIGKGDQRNRLLGDK